MFLLSPITYYMKLTCLLPTLIFSSAFLLNLQAQPFSYKKYITSPGGYSSESYKYAVNDFNSDNLPDVAVVSGAGGSSLDNRLAVFFNNGNQDYSQVTIEDNAYRWVKSGDLDNDGDIDLVALVEWIPQNWAIVSYLNDGSGSFSSITIATAGVSLVDVPELIDFDQDNDLDLFAWNKWYRNDGGNNYVLIDFFEEVDFSYQSDVVFTDVDSDNDLDILHGNRLYSNEGDTTFNQTLFNLSGTFQFDSKFGDLDGDGDIDIVSTGTNTYNGVHWLENDGNWNFSTNQLLAGPYAYLHGIADLDNDNDLDIICTDAQYYGTGVATSDIFVNDGSGNFTQQQFFGNPFTYSSYSYPNYYIGVFDMDGDQDNDLLVDGLGLGYIKNNGQLDFSYEQIELNQLITPFFNVVDGRPNLIDLDGDGDLDIINGGVKDDYWLENRSNGAIWKPSRIAGSPSAGGGNSEYFRGSKAVDFDQDNDIDLLTVKYHANSEYSVVGLQLNDGNGQFSYVKLDSVFVGSGYWNSAWDIDVTDIDNDNDLDILVLYEDGDVVRLLINMSNQTFIQTDIITSPLITNVNEIEVGEINGDSYPDIILSENYFNEKISWHLNNGDYTFTNNIVAIPPGNTPSGVGMTGDIEIIDLDGDGDDDIIGPYEAATDLYWFENVTNGNSWNIHLVSNSLSGIKAVDAADVDLDGDIDIVAVSSDDNDVDLYLNDGSENFTLNPIDGELLDGLWGDNASCNIGDVTSDGVPDIVVATPRTIVWYENQLNPTSVNKPSGIDGIKAYPNPVRNTVTITGDFTAENIQVTLLDISGRSVFLKNIPMLSNTGIDVSQLSKGIYTMIIDSPEGRFSEKIVVK